MNIEKQHSEKLRHKQDIELANRKIVTIVRYLRRYVVSKGDKSIWWIWSSRPHKWKRWNSIEATSMVLFLVLLQKSRVKSRIHDRQQLDISIWKIKATKRCLFEETKDHVEIRMKNDILFIKQTKVHCVLGTPLL